VWYIRSAAAPERADENKAPMHAESIIKFSCLAAALAGVVTFFYIKLTGKDDRNLHKQVFRVFVLVLLSNSVAYYFMQHGKDKLMSEPFFS
jgi:uncharacterized membrane protein